MPVARVAHFDSPDLMADDARRAATLRELVRQQPGFVGGYHFRDDTGRLMSVTVWDDDDAMLAGEDAVARRPAGDQRGIRPDRVERWVVEGVF